MSLESQLHVKSGRRLWNDRWAETVLLKLVNNRVMDTAPAFAASISINDT